MLNPSRGVGWNPAATLNPDGSAIEMCHLCTGRQADHVPDPWTERRKAQVLAELWAAERAVQARRPPVNRLRFALAGTATTATTSTGRFLP